MPLGDALAGHLASADGPGADGDALAGHLSSSTGSTCQVSSYGVIHDRIGAANPQMSSHAVTADAESPKDGQVSSYAVIHDRIGAANPQMSSHAVTVDTESPKVGQVSSHAVIHDNIDGPVRQVSSYAVIAVPALTSPAGTACETEQRVRQPAGHPMEAGSGWACGAMRR